MIDIESPSTEPYFNLALEEYIFEKMPRNETYLMLWQNDNTVVVGRYQNTREEIDPDFVRSHGIRVVRRLSGGGAVFHDRGNLNFTLVVDQSDRQEFDFSFFTAPVLQTLHELGVEAAFSGRNDLTIDGKKFCGNAQYARHGRLLHHGCIMLDSNITTVADALNAKPAKLASKGVRSVHSRVTTINANAPRHISMSEFKALLRTHISGSCERKPYTLTEDDLKEVVRLQREKYETWAWNYGASPAYQMRGEVKTDAGLIDARWTEHDGRICGVKLYGDFFGNGELRELEDALTGLATDGEMKRALERLPIGFYMSGITAADLYRLFARDAVCF